MCADLEAFIETVAWPALCGSLPFADHISEPVAGRTKANAGRSPRGVGFLVRPPETLNPICVSRWRACCCNPP
eukprot:7301882-Lingulodinium_polyedra.AAC.1